MRWEFTIEHVAGVRNFSPDALSRYPSGQKDGGSVSLLKGYSADDESWSADIEDQ